MFIDPSVYIFPPKDSEFYNKVKDVNILLDEVNDKVYISAVYVYIYICVFAYTFLSFENYGKSTKKIKLKKKSCC